MTFIQYNRSSHNHRYFVDSNSGDMYCLCGKKRDEKGGTGEGSKYKNRSTVYNGITYHSAFEAEYAAELDWKKKLELIKDWDRQVKLDLKVNGHHITNYYIDFIVHNTDGTNDFIETKGYSTNEFRIKWKLFEALFEEFKTTPDDRMLVIKQKDFKPH